MKQAHKKLSSSGVQRTGGDDASHQDGPPRRSLTERNKEVLHLLDRWLKDKSDYDERTWTDLKREIEQHRLSKRRRFRD